MSLAFCSHPDQKMNRTQKTTKQSNSRQKRCEVQLPACYPMASLATSHADSRNRSAPDSSPPPERFCPMASSSSMKMMAGACIDARKRRGRKNARADRVIWEAWHEPSCFSTLRSCFLISLDLPGPWKSRVLGP